MGQNNIIELNGKKYDARTGAFLGHGSSVSAGTPHGQTVDGVVRSAAARPTPARTTPAAAAKAARQLHAKATPTKVIGRPSKPHRQTTEAVLRKPAVKHAPATIKPHAPERPQTLMRRAVKKPSASLKPAIKTQAPTELTAARVSDIASPLSKKLSVSQVNPNRLAHAHAIAKSQQIERFPKVTAHAAMPAVVAAPAPAPRPRQHPVAPAQPLRNPISAAAASQAAMAPPAPERDIFEEAIAHATSHRQPAHHPKRSSRKLVNVFAGVTAFLILGGFIAYLNLTNIQLHVASLQVGFTATSPSYHVNGYALQGGVKAADKRVSLHYVSGDQDYTITQQASDWNSQTLLENSVALSGTSYKTIQDKGRTIYLYDGNQAAWVNGGILYNVSGSAHLTADDLVSLATSM